MDSDDEAKGGLKTLEVSQNIFVGSILTWILTMKKGNPKTLEVSQKVFGVHFYLDSDDVKKRGLKTVEVSQKHIWAFRALGVK